MPNLSPKSLFLGLALLISALACSTVDFVDPASTLYPRINGAFDFTANINESPTSRYTGVLDITRNSFTDPSFGGTYILTLRNSQTGQVLGTSSGEITSGLLGRDSTFQANLSDNSFRLSGTVRNSVITGSILVNSGFQTLTGSFTAIPRF